MALVIPGVVAQPPVPDEAVIAFVDFQLPTGTGTFDITTAKCQGLTPKGVLLILGDCEVDEVTHSVSAENSFKVVGAADGTNEWAMSGAVIPFGSGDNRIYSATHILYMGSVPHLDCTFDSFITNGVRISVDAIQTSAHSKRGIAMFFAGTDVEVAAGIVDNPGTSKNTNVGFEPDAVFYGWDNQATALSLSATCEIGLGMAENITDIPEFCVHHIRSAGDGSGSCEVASGGEPRDIVYNPFHTDAFDANGFTIGYDTTSTSDVGYLAFKLGTTKHVHIGYMTTPGVDGATGVRTTSNLEVTPEQAFFMMSGQGYRGESDTITNSWGWGVGWLESGGDAGSLWGQRFEAVWSDSRLYVEDGDTIADLDSFGAGTVALDFTAISTTVKGIWGFMTISADAPTIAAPSYGNPEGKGDRQSAIVETTNATFTVGADNEFIDGLYTNNTCRWTGGQSNIFLKWDFGVGVSKIIDEIIWYQNADGTHGTWKFQGSANDSDWDDLGGTFDLGGAAKPKPFPEAQVIDAMRGNTTGYRYYRLLQTAGTTSNTPHLWEIEFRITEE